MAVYTSICSTSSWEFVTTDDAEKAYIPKGEFKLGERNEYLGFMKKLDSLMLTLPQKYVSLAEQQEVKNRISGLRDQVTYYCKSEDYFGSLHGDSAVNALQSFIELRESVPVTEKWRFNYNLVESNGVVEWGLTLEIDEVCVGRFCPLYQELNPLTFDELKLLKIKDDMFQACGNALPYKIFCKWYAELTNESLPPEKIVEQAVTYIDLIPTAARRCLDISIVEATEQDKGSPAGTLIIRVMNCVVLKKILPSETENRLCSLNIRARIVELKFLQQVSHENLTHKELVEELGKIVNVQSRFFVALQAWSQLKALSSPLLAPQFKLSVITNTLSKDSPNCICVLELPFGVRGEFRIQVFQCAFGVYSYTDEYRKYLLLSRADLICGEIPKPKQTTLINTAKRKIDAAKAELPKRENNAIDDILFDVFMDLGVVEREQKVREKYTELQQVASKIKDQRAQQKRQADAQRQQELRAAAAAETERRRKVELQEKHDLELARKIHKVEKKKEQQWQLEQLRKAQQEYELKLAHEAELLAVYKEKQQRQRQQQASCSGDVELAVKLQHQEGGFAAATLEYQRVNQQRAIEAATVHIIEKCSLSGITKELMILLESLSDENIKPADKVRNLMAMLELLPTSNRRNFSIEFSESKHSVSGRLCVSMNGLPLIVVDDRQDFLTEYQWQALKGKVATFQRICRGELFAKDTGSVKELAVETSPQLPKKVIMSTAELVSRFHDIAKDIARDPTAVIQDSTKCSLLKLGGKPVIYNANVRKGLKGLFCDLNNKTGKKNSVDAYSLLSDNLIDFPPCCRPQVTSAADRGTTYRLVTKH
ncbi:MAG: hypothetical protein ACPGUD_05865 [Parashewanella sp.]